MSGLPPGRRGPARPRVLVVDDNEVSRRVAERYLSGLHVDAVLATGGHPALDRLAAQPFDLVLLDGMMPRLDGPASAREVRRREQAAGLAPIPIVALTGSVAAEDHDRMLAAGMDDVVVKPVRAEDLERVLARWVPRDAPRRTVVIPPIAAAAASPAAPDAPVPPALAVDPGAFARIADLGDAAFVDRIVRLFLADAAHRVAQVEDAVEAGDAAGVEAALRALEGICANVGAAALGRRARELQAAIRRRRDAGGDPLGASLEPTGLEGLLDATRLGLRELLEDAR